MKVLIASNGDIIIDFGKMDVSPTEYTLAIAQAQRMLDDGETEFVKAVKKSEPVSHLDYLNAGGKFLATAGIHVSEKYDPVNTMMYLRRMSGSKDIEKMMKKVERIAKKA